MMRRFPPVTRTFLGCQPAARGRGDVTWSLRCSAGAAETSGGHLTGASPQPDEACRWSALFWGLRSAGEERDRRAATVYEPS